MTCEICVMNRHAAVLAADSASTVSRWVNGTVETRYFKGANKIFQLSHHHPVGLMIFDTAELLRVPWEVLIKSFRDYLGNRSFNHLAGYVDEFFGFLEAQVAFFFPEEVQREEMYGAAQRAALELALDVVRDIGKISNDDITRLLAAIEKRQTAIEAIAFPGQISEERALAAIVAHQEAVSERLSHMFKDHPHVWGPLAELGIHEVYRRPFKLFNAAGLVFAGFGDRDIFPTMLEHEASGILDGILVRKSGQTESVTHSVPASLNAFAQTSMSDTFSLGFSEDVYSALMDCLSVQLQDFAKSVCDAAGADISGIENLRALIADTRSKISDGWFDRARQEHAYPLRRVLGALPVEEMAELAETLVNLQSLKEKVTKPSASVGGPVDVAIITKNEGLVWAKRKFFFDGSLNPRYQYRQQALYRT